MGWGEAGVGFVIREGLEGAAGDEYERDPRLPPLPARAHTDAVSNTSSEISDRPNMSAKALGRMVASWCHSTAFRE
jgi:hypothetical protein